MGKHPAEIHSITGVVTYADGRTSNFSLNNVAGQWAWSQGGMDAHTLGERGAGDVLDGLAKAVVEHQRKNVPTTHWHVGANVPGYLPESDAVCVFDTNEARDVLVGNWIEPVPREECGIETE